MTAEEHVIAAMKAELQRQAADSDGSLAVASGREDDREDRIVLHGKVDLAALAMAAVGSLSGGP